MKLEKTYIAKDGTRFLENRRGCLRHDFTSDLAQMLAEDNADGDHWWLASRFAALLENNGAALKRLIEGYDNARIFESIAERGRE